MFQCRGHHATPFAGYGLSIDDPNVGSGDLRLPIRRAIDAVIGRGVPLFVIHYGDLLINPQPGKIAFLAKVVTVAAGE
ncbi:MAG: hypothetical protein ACRCR6_08205 [Plesiomonas sp.]